MYRYVTAVFRKNFAEIIAVLCFVWFLRVMLLCLLLCVVFVNFC